MQQNWNANCFGTTATLRSSGLLFGANLSTKPSTDSWASSLASFVPALGQRIRRNMSPERAPGGEWRNQQHHNCYNDMRHSGCQGSTNLYTHLLKSSVHVFCSPWIHMDPMTLWRGSKHQNQDGLNFALVKVAKAPMMRWRFWTATGRSKIQML